MSRPPRGEPAHGPLGRWIRFFIENPLLAGLALLVIVGWGLYVMPFDGEFGELPRDPVPVDALPDIGDNQQIVFTEWPGRSPQDVEDQITYPLTVELLGVPGVKTVRSFSYLGFSTVYVVFKDGVDFHWSRSRILERVASSAKKLPADVSPVLGPDATALGQVFWYTLEGEGFSLHELRSIQDWTVRYALQSADGVAEVASVGGYVREYQIDVNPDAMRAHSVSLHDVFRAVRRSNLDVGARTLDVNGVEYVVRGVGFLESVEDLERSVVREADGVPVYLSNVGRVSLGPAMRRGALDKEGAEAVGGVVVVRFGANPLEVIGNVKEKIAEISMGLPSRTLPDGRVSQVRIVPFYDRTELIHETLDTLEEALELEVLVTILVVLVMLAHFRASLLVSGMLPLAVLLAFVAMRYLHIDSNIMSLSGIAIAIGTIVDMGVIMTENMLRNLRERDGPVSEIVFDSAREVGGAVVTAIATTVVSFVPVFAMTGAEGKLFTPLAYTKTFALLASVVIALTLLPPFARLLLRRRKAKAAEGRLRQRAPLAFNILAVLAVWLLLSFHWMPLGYGNGRILNAVFVGLVVGGVLLGFTLFIRIYPRLLASFLRHKLLFSLLPVAVVLFGVTTWLGFDKTFAPVRQGLAAVGVEQNVLRSTTFWTGASHDFPGFQKEFMPDLDEGSFLLMPTTMPHASIGEALDVLQTQDMAIRAIPEVDSVVGKIGRVESALDPAPLSMVETIITYRPEYGQRDPETGQRERLWRDHIHEPDDIWKEIVKAAEVLGTTSAPRLQPIAARLVMLQSGMRAPMGVKVLGASLEDIERAALDIEKLLKEVPEIDRRTVIADRVVGKPYLEIHVDREAAARYGINVQDVQDVIEVAIGGVPITQTVEGRERYPVRVRYQRELRDSIEELGRVLVAGAGGEQVPLEQLSDVRYLRGPQVVKSEDTFLVGYVLFDMAEGRSEVETVEAARAYLDAKRDSGDFTLPAGTTYRFAGAYENQVRAEKKLSVLVPLALVVIFVILYLQFRRVSTTALVFSGILVAWSGGFILLWLYGQGWFLDFSLGGVDMRDLFQVGPIHLSVAVWVGFIALFGIASDDGVVMATFLDQSFQRSQPKSVEEIRAATLEAGRRRVRPCLMTTATTILALLPVVTSQGRGSDVMVPMALPTLGGMLVALLTLFVVPVGYTGLAEMRLRGSRRNATDPNP